MEHFAISKTDSGLHVEGVPEAVKLIRIDGPQAKRLADLALHKADLEFAAESLEAINRVPEEPRIVRQALWRCAIVHYAKCFGDSGARFQLSAEKIYKGELLGLVAFNYFRDLRNKHVVHDENSYAQSIPGAALNKGDKEFKIEKIVCVSAIAETLDQENYSNLQLLIQKAREWVISEFDRFCELLTKELEAESYQDLLNRQGVTYRVPMVEEIAKNRTGASTRTRHKRRAG